MVYPVQEIELANGKLLTVAKGWLELAGDTPRPRLCTDGTPLRQLVDGVYLDGTTVPCPQLTIEGETFDVVSASIGFTLTVED